MSEMNVLNNGHLKEAKFKKDVLDRIWKEAYPKSEASTQSDEPIKEGAE
jgi:hypothetical protein